MHTSPDGISSCQEQLQQVSNIYIPIFLIWKFLQSTNRKRHEHSFLYQPPGSCSKKSFVPSDDRLSGKNKEMHLCTLPVISKKGDVFYSFRSIGDIPATSQRPDSSGSVSATNGSGRTPSMKSYQTLSYSSLNTLSGLTRAGSKRSHTTNLDTLLKIRDVVNTRLEQLQSSNFCKFPHLTMDMHI